MKQWVCQKNKTHIFDKYNPDPEHPYYCSIDDPFEGILKEEEVPFQQISLCVLLMDASSSMTDVAFDGIPLSKMTLVANSAASGIFELERIQGTSNMYVACFKFDDRVQLMFVDTVANIIDRYKKIDIFAAYLHNELFAFQQGTDINEALNVAHFFIREFFKRQLDIFPTRNYTPVMQRFLKFNTIETVSIPNVRVLIYTDGSQYASNGDKVLKANPFKQRPITEMNHDIVMAVYIGSEADPGCKDLRNLVSNCPIHDVTQFFVFDTPAKMGNMIYLFRMASGATGFCPRCAEKIIPAEISVDSSQNLKYANHTVPLKSSENKIWICSKDRTHRFNLSEAEENLHWCPVCPSFEGILTAEECSPSPQSDPNTDQHSLNQENSWIETFPSPRASSYPPSILQHPPSDIFDFVKFTVYAPPNTLPGKNVMVQVFAHHFGEEENIKNLATEFDEKARIRATKQLDYEIRQGSELCFHLSMEGVKVDEPIQKIFWRGQTESIQFGIYIPEEYILGNIIGTIYVTQNSIPFGHVKFTIMVDNGADNSISRNERQKISDKWKRYRYAFISYASADRPEVLKRVQMLPRAGISVFQDLLSLEPGERWEKSLYKHIDISDVFFLFWSTEAKNSKWVMEEVRYAMKRSGHMLSGSPEIVPIIIEGPPPVLPPPELKGLHFNDPFIYFINS